MDDRNEGEAAPQAEELGDARLRGIVLGDLRPMFELLVRRRRVTHEDLAVSADLTESALRARKTRNPALKALLVDAGQLRTRDPGRKPGLYMLSPREKARVAAILQDAAPVEVDSPMVSRFARLDILHALLDRADERRHGLLSDAFKLLEAAEAERAAMEERVAGLKRRNRAAPAALEAWERSATQVEAFKNTLFTDSKAKRRDFDKRKLEFTAASVEERRMEEYFSHVPDRSLTGFGGALGARLDGDPRNFDIFIADRLERPDTRRRFSVSIAHAIDETMTLFRYDPKWKAETLMLFECISDSAPLIRQPGLREAIKINLPKLTAGADVQAQADVRVRAADILRRFSPQEQGRADEGVGGAGPGASGAEDSGAPPPGEHGRQDAAESDAPRREEMTATEAAPMDAPVGDASVQPRGDAGSGFTLKDRDQIAAMLASAGGQRASVEAAPQ